MIRVFVGCAANGEDIESQAVLEYTLRKHASEPVEITWMQLSRGQSSPFFSNGVRGGWRTDAWSTPFSGFRWAVPSFCHFSGRALYCDSDVIFMADVAELFAQTLAPGKSVLAKGGEDAWRFCVTLFDCAAVRPHMMPIADLMRNPSAHQTMINRFKAGNFVQRFSGNWNCIDGEDYRSLDDPEIKVIHYSSEAHQPQLKHAIPRLAKEGRKHWFDGQVKPHWRPELQVLFDCLLSEATSAGFHLKSYVPDSLFGTYRKKSHAGGYRSHRFAPA